MAILHLSSAPLKKKATEKEMSILLKEAEGYKIVRVCVYSKVKAWRQKKALTSVKKAQSGRRAQRWEEDYELIECEGLFDEYLEIGMTLKDYWPLGTVLILKFAKMLILRTHCAMTATFQLQFNL